jgi:hypothetical protein
MNGSGGVNLTNVANSPTPNNFVPVANHVWDIGTLRWVMMTQPSGGGGAVTIANGADVAEGATTDAAVTSDTTGTVSGKLRGLVKWAYERMPAALGQTTMTGSLPVVIASNQSAVPISAAALPLPTGAATEATLLTRAAAAQLPAVLGQTTMAGSLSIAIASNQTAVPVNPTGETAGVGVGAAADAAAVGNGSLIAITKQLRVLLAGGLPAALVGGRLDDNIGSWLGSAAPTVGQKTMANSIPFALASDQTTFPAQAEARAGTLWVTATAAVNTGSTLTLPAAGAGLFHYIVFLQLQKLYSVIGVAAGAGVIITTTNFNGAAFTTEQLASAAGTVATVINFAPSTPARSQVANTATTFVAGAQLQTIWRWNVCYFTAA